jgi:DNA-binding NarL/FixJ family response regulator
MGRVECRVHLAGALLATAGDRAVAGERLREASSLAAAQGADAWVDTVARIAHAARVPLGPGPATGQDGGPRRAARALGLSERETDVLELLAIGASDREIAHRLYITEKTAGHHVSHILTKLTLARRGEAAAVAHRIGLSGSGGTSD